MYLEGKYMHEYDENTQKLAVLDTEQFIEEFITDHIKNLNLKRRGNSFDNQPDHKFIYNKDFWNCVLNSPHQKLNWVELNNFQIIDWFPRSPGLYYTDDAKYKRKMAMEDIQEKDGISFFKPRGKYHMIEGGVGSIRFKSIILENEDCQLCTATSNQYCDTGIPLAIPTYLLRKIDFRFDFFYKIMGQVKFLPEFLEHHFYHSVNIPQIYILIDSIKRIDKTATISNPKITPMVFFKAKNRKYINEIVNYVTYVVCDSTNLKELDRGVEWIEWYVNEHAGEIITNFDQQRPTFRNAPFSLGNVMDGNISDIALKNLNIRNAEIICNDIREIKAEVMNMSQISVTLGNDVVIKGDFVVANKIKDSFNKVDSSNVQEDLKEILKNLTTTVGQLTEQLPKEQAEQVVNDLQVIMNEATSSKPRRRWWELSVEGIKEAALTVGIIGKPVLTCLEKLIPLLV